MRVCTSPRARVLFDAVTYRSVRSSIAERLWKTAAWRMFLIVQNGTYSSIGECVSLENRPLNPKQPLDLFHAIPNTCLSHWTREKFIHGPCDSRSSFTRHRRHCNLPANLLSRTYWTGPIETSLVPLWQNVINQLHAAFQNIRAECSSFALRVSLCQETVAGCLAIVFQPTWRAFFADRRWLNEFALNEFSWAREKFKSIR